MANTIVTLRGLKARRPTLEPGQLFYATDTEQLYVGAYLGAVLVNGGPSDIGAEHAALRFFDTLIPPALWVTDDTDPDYPLRAAVPLEGVEASGVPAVAFAPAEKNSGNYSQTATAYDGGVYLYAKTAPGSEISVPTIIVWR